MKSIKKAYFLGIGGIGMSAIARYYNAYGIRVAGYDKTPTDLTNELIAEGIEIHFDENIDTMKSFIDGVDASELSIVFTPAIPKNHKEFVYLTEHKYELKKRSEILGEISSAFKTIAIAGTHGKTTTTTMVTHLLKSAGVNCFAFLGGISKNYNTNLLLGDASKDCYVVVEADEYDRSFLTLNPDIAIITSIDADHLDIYGDENSMVETYDLFSKKLKSNGTLIVKDVVDQTLKSTLKKVTYSLNSDKADSYANEIKLNIDKYNFNLNVNKITIDNLTLGFPGLHNVENAVAAINAALLAGLTPEQIQKGLASFDGVKRRFDYQVRNEKHIYIDDYAHHPEELRAIITSVKKIYPTKKLTGVFQPHLYTRTRDFAQGFANSLDLLDECILLDIYPARELPIEGVSSTMLMNLMKSTNKVLVTKPELVAYIQKRNPELILTLGAGDIDNFIEPIKVILS